MIVIDGLKHDRHDWRSKSFVISSQF